LHRPGRVPRLPIVAALLLALVVLTGVPAWGAKAGRVHRVPASIPYDCSVDVTTRLTTWITKVPDRSTISFRKDGCYRIDGTLAMVNRAHLTFAGNGATLRATTPGDQGRRHVSFVGGTDLVVRDFVVRGANPNAGATPAAYVAQKAFQHAFAFTGVAGARLEHVQAFDVYGDFVYIGAGGPQQRWSSDIRITDSRFEGSGRQGISVTAGEHIVIARNEIGGVGRSLFDLEANTADGGARDVLITHNVTGAATNFWLANKGVGTQISDIVFTKNKMVEGTGGLVFVYGPTSGYRGPFVFEGNSLIVTDRVHDEGSVGAFFLSRASDVSILDNEVTFPLGRAVPVVEVQDSTNVRVEGNTFTNAGAAQITTVRPGVAQP